MSIEIVLLITIAGVILCYLMLKWHEMVKINQERQSLAGIQASIIGALADIDSRVRDNQGLWSDATQSPWALGYLSGFCEHYLFARGVLPFYPQAGDAVVRNVFETLHGPISGGILFYRHKEYRTSDESNSASGNLCGRQDASKKMDDPASTPFRLVAHCLGEQKD